MATIQRPRRKRPEDLAVVTVGEREVRRLFEACEDWDEILCFACLAYLGPRRNAAARVNAAMSIWDAARSASWRRAGKSR